MIIQIDTNTLAGYNQFIQCKRLPSYEVVGNTVHTDKASYDYVFGGKSGKVLRTESKIAFDYQKAEVNKALAKNRYAIFADCGLGKTLMFLLWAEQVCKEGKVLILCPLIVIDEIIRDADKFGIKVPITVLRDGYDAWTEGLGIINYEQPRRIPMKGVKGVVLDESSILKNGDGVVKKWLVELTANVDYRLACSATPAPNEQSEYASHAVFLGINRTNKEFYSRYFRKNGNNWNLKPHGVKPFYQNLASWSCYIQDPTAIGYEPGGYLNEEPEYTVIPCEEISQSKGGVLFHTSLGLNDARVIFKARAIEGTDRFNTVVAKAQEGKSIVWCKYNDEETNFGKAIPNSAVITGNTKIEKRIEIINAWRAGEINTIVSKPSILGWGVNMQQADLHVYSGYDFSFESFYQAVRRSHRYGRDGRLKVFIPMTPSERGIYATLERKIKGFKSDVTELQALYQI